MKLSLHDFVVNRLLASHGTWTVIARESGVSIRTLQKIAHRQIADPGVSHIEKLIAYFTEHPFTEPSVAPKATPKSET